MWACRVRVVIAVGLACCVVLWCVVMCAFFIYGVFYGLVLCYRYSKLFVVYCVCVVVVVWCVVCCVSVWIWLGC